MTWAHSRSRRGVACCESCSSIATGKARVVQILLNDVLFFSCWRLHARQLHARKSGCMVRMLITVEERAHMP